MLQFGALVKGGHRHRLSLKITITPAKIEVSESTQCRKYKGWTLLGMDAEIGLFGGEVEMPVYSSLPNLVSSHPNKILHLALSTLRQRN